MTSYKELSIRLRTLIAEEKQLLVAIDGRCCSGKSTLANELGNQFTASIIHMDDFYLPVHLQTLEKQAIPAGHMDLVRFHEEILRPLATGSHELQYRPFSCRTQSYLDPITVPITPLMIIEGAYCLHPSLADYFTYKIMLSHSKERQLERLKLRNSELQVQTFINRWIPMEEYYFATYSIEKKCDLFIKTDHLF